MGEASTIEAYLAALPAPRREKIADFIALIRAVAPHATPSITFNMPTFEHQGGTIAIANRKTYVCIYVSTNPALAAQLKTASPGAAGGKACVNYPDRVPIPQAAARNIIKQVLSPGA